MVAGDSFLCSCRWEWEDNSCTSEAYPSLEHGNLPVKIRRSYDNNWKAIMELLEEEVKEEVRNRHVDDMDSDFF